MTRNLDKGYVLRKVYAKKEGEQNLYKIRNDESNEVVHKQFSHRAVIFVRRRRELMVYKVKSWLRLTPKERYLLLFAISKLQEEKR